MEVKLTNYCGKGGEPVLIIRKTFQPEKYIEVIIEDKFARVDVKELKAAVEAVSQ